MCRGRARCPYGKKRLDSGARKYENRYFLFFSLVRLRWVKRNSTGNMWMTTSVAVLRIILVSIWAPGYFRWYLWNGLRDQLYLTPASQKCTKKTFWISLVNEYITTWCWVNWNFVGGVFLVLFSISVFVSRRCVTFMPWLKSLHSNLEPAASHLAYRTHHDILVIV